MLVFSNRLYFYLFNNHHILLPMLLHWKFYKVGMNNFTLELHKWLFIYKDLKVLYLICLYASVNQFYFDYMAFPNNITNK